MARANEEQRGLRLFEQEEEGLPGDSKLSVRVLNSLRNEWGPTSIVLRVVLLVDVRPSRIRVLDVRSRRRLDLVVYSESSSNLRKGRY